jgi:hypothetical protein
MLLCVLASWRESFLLFRAPQNRSHLAYLIILPEEAIRIPRREGVTKSKRNEKCAARFRDKQRYLLLPERKSEEGGQEKIKC